MLLGTKGIGQKIIWVKFNMNMCYTCHACSYSFSNLTIGNGIVLLFEYSKGDGTTGHTFIIYHNLGWSINIKLEHSKLVVTFHGQSRGDSYGQQI